jgi:hypothetical protein
MNRLAPLIVRDRRAFAGTVAPAAPRAPFRPFGDPPPTADEWRLFATTFLAGLVFFGTYLA